MSICAFQGSQADDMEKVIVSGNELLLDAEPGVQQTPGVNQATENPGIPQQDHVGTYPVSPPWRQETIFPNEPDIQQYLDSSWFDNGETMNIFGTGSGGPKPLAVYNVDGAFQYQDREQNQTGFTGINPLKPVRYADVQLYDVDSGAVLGTACTNATGVFHMTVTDTLIHNVSIRAVTSSYYHLNLFNQSVRTLPSQGGNLYSVNTSVYYSHPLTDINFTGSPAQALSGGMGGPFHLFDMAECAENYVENLTSALPRDNLTIYWSQGQSGGKYYDTDGHIYLEGTSSDDDSYDDNVILHEVGHYIALSYSQDAGYYGAHSLSDNSDIRLAYTEGLASYLMGAVRNYLGVPQPLIYIETNGVNLNWYGFSIWYNTDIPSGYTSAPLPYSLKTDESEVTVGHALFDIVDKTGTNDGSPGIDDDPLGLPGLQGDQLVWNVLVSIDGNATFFTKKITMETFVDTWRTINSYNTELTQILSMNGIEFFNDTYEPDDTYTTAKAMVIGNSTAYHNTYFEAGDADWASVALTSGTDYVFKTEALYDGADTKLELYGTDGTTLLASNNDRDKTTKASLIRYVASTNGTHYLRSLRNLEIPMPIGEYGKYNLTSYVVLNPTITTIIPDTGPVQGGTIVNITGTDFQTSSTVFIGVYQAVNVSLAGNILTVTTPANVPGPVNVSVYNPPTSDNIIPYCTRQNGFTYFGEALPPDVKGITPSFGSSNGTTNAVVSGDYFIPGASLHLGAFEPMNYTVVDPKTINAVIQALPADLYDVNVTNPNAKYDVLPKGYESVCQPFNNTAATFTASNPLNTNISVSDDFIISDLYVFVNVSCPAGYEPIITLKSPGGRTAKVFDELHIVEDETFILRANFSVWFGYEEPPSEGLWQYRGESTKGNWTLTLASTTSTPSTLHSWGISFFRYRYRNISRIVYTPGEYRNWLVALDEATGEQLFRPKMGDYPASLTVSADQTKLYAGTYTYYNSSTGGYTDSLVTCFETQTGKKLTSFRLEGHMARKGLAAASDKLLAATSYHLYTINTTTNTIVGQISTPAFHTFEVDVTATSNGSKAYLVANDATAQYVQVANLKTQTLSGQIATPGQTPSDVDVSLDRNTGIIFYSNSLMDVFNPANDIISKRVTLPGWGSWASLTPDGSKAFYGVFQWYAGFGAINLTTEVGHKIMDHPDSTTCAAKVSNNYIAYVTDWYRGKILKYDARSEGKIGELDAKDFSSVYPTAVDYADLASAPLNLSAVVMNGGNISLNWGKPASNGTNISFYKIYRGNASGKETYFYNTTSTSFIDYNITGGHYYYRVSAVNGAGEGLLSNEADAISLAPVVIIDYPSLPNIIEKSLVEISWTITDNDPWPNGGNVVNLSYSSNGGTAWTPLASNINVNSDPYIWDASALPDGVNYLLKATAYDATSQTGTGLSDNPFSLDNKPDDRWHFQAQMNGSLRDLDMKPVEPGQQMISVAVDSAGEHVIGKWEGRSFPAGRNISGQWNFSAWGYVSVQGLCSAHLKAKIFTSSNPAPLYATVLDNEDINNYTGTYHEFYWQDAGVSGMILPGDRVQVELVLNASFGTGTNYVYDNTTGDIPGNGTVTGTHVNTQNSDNVYQSIKEVPAGQVTLASTDFNGTFPPSGWFVFTGDPTTYWRLDGGNSAGGTPPEANLYHGGLGNVSTWRLYAGPIDTSQVTNLTLRWDNFFNDWVGAGCDMLIQTSSDGSTWHNTTWILHSGSGSVGPAPVILPIITSDAGSPTFYFSFSVIGEPYHINYWFVDTVRLTGNSTSVLDHKWTINVTGSLTEVLFGVEAYVSPGEAVSVYYSTTGSGQVGGSGWSHMLEVTKTSDDNSAQTFALPVGTSGTIYIGATDINRTYGDKTLDTIFIDRMFVRSEFTSPIFHFGFDYGQTQSYVETRFATQPIYNISVKPGWNFISFPLLASGSPQAVLNDAVGDNSTKWNLVRWYDANDQADHWKTYSTFAPPSLNDLSSVNNTKGFWLYITQLGDGNLTVQGAEPTATSIQLKAGWNMVGYPSYTEKTISDALAGMNADKVEVCDMADPYQTKEVGSTYLMRPGEGYWVHVPADTIWTVNW